MMTPALEAMAAVGTAAMGLSGYRWAGLQRRADADRVTWRLHLPRGIAPDAVVDLLRSLSVLPAGGFMSAAPNLVFEVVAQGGEIRHLLSVPKARAEATRRQLGIYVPRIVTEEVRRSLPPITYAAELRLVPLLGSLRTDARPAVAASLLGVLAGAASGETVVWQVVVMADHTPVVAASPAASARQNGRGLITDVARLFQGPTSAVLSPKQFRDKTAEPLVGVSLRIGARTATQGRSRRLVGAAMATMSQLGGPEGHFRLRQLPVRTVVRRITMAAAPLVERPAVVNVRELSGLLGWPLGDLVVPGLGLMSHQRLAAAAGFPPRGRILGVSAMPGSHRPLALGVNDSLRHLHVMGPTGVGKSTLLAQIALQDIATGRGAVVIDPKRDLVEAILGRLPEDRRDDVIVLDATDTGRPVGYNPLADAARAPERVAGEVVGLFHRLFASSWGPRTADVLRSCVLSLATTPGTTLVDVPLLLTDEAFRRRIVAGVHDRFLLGFWSSYGAMSDAERAQVIGPAMNKLRAFMAPRLRGILGQAEPTWTFEAVLEERKVLLVALGRGELGGETARLVGSLVVAGLWQAIQRRRSRRPVFVVLDEFQDVSDLDTDLAEVLAQSRGFGVGFTLAHQHLGQLDARMRAAVLANARSRVVFQTSADDARTMSTQLGGELTPTDLMSLPAYEAYLAACQDGAVRPPVSLRTRPLGPALGGAAAVRHASSKRYGRDRAEVEAAMAARQERPTGAGRVGRRPRGEGEQL